MKKIFHAAVSNPKCNRYQDVILFTAPGSPVGDDKAAGTLIDASDPGSIYTSFGGSSDTWNAGLTSAQVNASTFGVSFCFIASFADAGINVDHVRITITYAPVVAPTVTTNFAVPGANTATLSGTKTSGTDTVNYGFAYSTNATLSSGVATSALGVLSTNSTFTNYISGLTENQTYYFRAYATNTAGSAYGVIKSFLTGNSTPKRTMRLFEGVRIKFFSGRIILHQK